MTTKKQSWLKQSLAVLLAVMMVMSMGISNVFAAGGEGNGTTPAAGYSTVQTENSVMSLTAGENTYYFDDVASAFAAVDDTTNITGDVTLKVLKDDQTYPVGTTEEYSTTVFEKATGTVTLDLNGHNLTLAGQSPSSSCYLAILSPAFTLTDSTCTESKAVVDGKENESFEAGKLTLTNVYLNYNGTGTLTIRNIKAEILGENGDNFVRSANASTFEIDNIAVDRKTAEKGAMILRFTNRNATGGVITDSVLKNAYGGGIQLYGEAVLRNNVVVANHTSSGSAALGLSYNTVTVESGSYTNLGENGYAVVQRLRGVAYLKGGAFTGALSTNSRSSGEIEITGGYYKGEWKEAKEGTITADNCKTEIISDGEYAGYTQYILLSAHNVDISVTDENGMITTAATVSATADGSNLPDLGIAYEGQSVVYTVDCKQDYEVKKITYTPSGEASQEITGNSTYTMTVPDKDYTLVFTVGEIDAVKAGDTVASINEKEYKSLTTAIAELKDDETLKLESNIYYADEIKITQSNVTLDLNGKTLTMDVPKPEDATYGSVAALLIWDGDLTITDSETNGAISFNNNESDGIALIGTKAILSVKGGIIKDIGAGANLIANNAAEGEINLSGGTMIGIVNLRSTSGFESDITPSANLTISDGAVLKTNTYSRTVIRSMGKNDQIKITGGEIYSEEDALGEMGVVDLRTNGDAAESVVFEMTGGKIICENDAVGISDWYTTTGTIKVGGNAEITTKLGAAIWMSSVSFNSDSYLNSVVIIEENAKLKSDTYTVEVDETYEFRPKVTINGGYYACGEDYLPIKNTVYTIFPEGKVLNTDTETAGEYADYYSLVDASALGGVYYPSEETGLGPQEYTYQDFDGISDGSGQGLRQVIEMAEEIYAAGNEEEKYPSETWTTFTEAYSTAVATLTNVNANQKEIDFRAAKLSEGLLALQVASDLNVNDLADGTYRIGVGVWKYDMVTPSMSNGAVDSNAILTIKDGKASIELTFKPLYQYMLYGHLMSFYIYRGESKSDAYTYMVMDTSEVDAIGMREEASYANWYKGYDNFDQTFRKDVDGIDEKSDEYNLPGTVTVDLPYLGTTDELRAYCVGMFVDAMNSYATAILMLNWSSLEAVNVEPTLSLSAYELSMMVGDEETVIATLKGEVSEGYTVTGWESNKTSVATVENGTIKAVGEGTATITVTASNGTDSISETIAVTVAPEGSEAVKVEKVETSGNTETATLSGSFLTSSGAEGIALNGNTVTIDAKSDGSNITSSKVVIPQETAQALAGKTVVVETSTGSISLNSALLAQIAGVENGVTLSISKAATPVGLGTFSSAYEISLVDANGDAVEFGEGQATVTVTSEETVNYAYCIDNGQRTERVATSTSGNSVSFTVSHFSLWALSDREYEVGGSTGSGFFLEDGNYYVDIALWKSDSNEASMGNVAFKNNDKALVTVENGKITRVQIGTNPVDIDPYHSAIISFELADGTKVKIEAKGDLTTIPANKDYTYIKLVSFNLPDSAQPDIKDAVTYVPVNFYVPDTPMDAAVGETLTARLRFTWSTAVKTNDTFLQVDDTTAAGDSPITGEEIVDVNLVDEATGIKLETNSGILSDKAVLSVEKLTQGADYDIAMKAMNGVDGSWNLYKITALVDGVETAPLGSVVLYIPCGAEGMTLYRVNTDGTKTLVRGEVQDGYYVVRTTSLGLFAMVGEAAGTPGGTQDGNQNSNTNIPQTGDNSNVAVYALLALAAAGMMGVTLVTRKRKAEEK